MKLLMEVGITEQPVLSCGCIEGLMESVSARNKLGSVAACV